MKCEICQKEMTIISTNPIMKIYTCFEEHDDGTSDSTAREIRTLAEDLTDPFNASY